MDTCTSTGILFLGTGIAPKLNRCWELLLTKYFNLRGKIFYYLVVFDIFAVKFPCTAYDRNTAQLILYPGLPGT